MLLPTLLFGMLWALANGQWCEWTEIIHEEEEVTPRQEDLVPCTSLYHYSLLGWRLDLPYWGGRGGFTRSPAPGLCPIYTAPKMQPVTRNRTVRACCPGWGGGHCTYLLAGATDFTWAVHLGPQGHCSQPGHCQLVRVMLGFEDVLIQGDDFMEPGGRLAVLPATFGNSWRLPSLRAPVPRRPALSDCISSCPASCSAVGQGEEGPCAEDCVRGCECPPGLFWDGIHCVSAAHCPCYHRRQRYAPGDTVHRWCNPCVCQDGHWLCARAPCPTECAVGGDGHYLTFDRWSFSFRGGSGCRYILVQDHMQGQLLMVLEHGACDSGSCLHALSVSLEDTHIQLRDSGAVLVDGQDVGLPWTGTAGLSVSQAASSFLLLRWPGARVLWGVADPAAYITLDPRHAHQVQGLCATFTWNQQDDFLAPAGDVETSIAVSGSKFQVAGGGRGRCPPEDSVLLSPCSTYSQNLAFTEACAILHSPAFQACHGLVDREAFQLRCLAAMCGCSPGRDCLCPVLSAYARRCAREGALLLWRNQTLCRPVCGPQRTCQLGTHRYTPGSVTQKDCNHCICQERGLWNCTAHHCPPKRAFYPQELIYDPSTCLLTCDSPNANHSCPAGSSDGCVCPPGTVVLDEHCVPPDLCPCRHSGQWYPPNATIQEDCNTCAYVELLNLDWLHPLCAAPKFLSSENLSPVLLHSVCQSRQWRRTGQRCSGRCQNLPCRASGLTCTKALTVRLESTVVHMLRGRAVTVNGVSIRHPKAYTGLGLSLHHAGLFLLLTTRLGLTLLWDRVHFVLPLLGTRVLVQLCPHFRGRVAALCGDFDGDASNDPQSRQGVLEPMAELAAHSWHLNPLCPEPGDLLPPCTVNAHWAAWARTRTRCGAMLQPLFAPCHAEVPEEPVWTQLPVPVSGVAASSHRGQCCRRTVGTEGEAPYQDSGHCVPHEWLCDNQDDCGDGSDEEACATPGCGQGQMSCQSGRCIPPAQLSDGQDDCGNGTDEQGCPCPSNSLACTAGHCLPLSLLCDGHSDCLDAADEESCLEGLPPPAGHNRTGVPCPEYSCPNGIYIGFQRVCDGQPDCEVALGETGPSPEEQACGAWSSWNPWEPCSQTCGPGVRARRHRCSPPGLPVLQRCPGPEHQSQACFAEACPVDHEWGSWSPWSLCSEQRGGTMTRQRQCHPPQNGGRACALLPGDPPSIETKPCPQDGSPNATCSGELVFWPCAPCPLTCDDISGQAVCPPERPCSSPVNCCWSSWSPWAECLGPCRSQSIRWSFRSPNNPRQSGQGHQCRGIHRKAHRCQMELSQGFKQQGRVRRVGECWRRGPCRVCQCLGLSAVHCSPYCQLGSCPQGWVLVEGVGESCCHCALPGENQTAPLMATSAPAPAPSPQIGHSLVTYVLPPPGDSCYLPLGLPQPPKESLQVLPPELEHPTHAALQGVPTEAPGPGEDAHAEWHPWPPYLQLDLLWPRNLSGIVVWETRSSDTHVPSFSLQFSSDGLHWHDYCDILPGTLPLPKPFPGSQANMAPRGWIFGQLVQARYVRVWPHTSHHSEGHSIFHWAEPLGCGPVSPMASRCPGSGLQCASGECAPSGAPCDGAADCEDSSDEEGCGPSPVGTGGLKSSGSHCSVVSATQKPRVPSLGSVSLPLVARRAGSINSLPLPPAEERPGSPVEACGSPHPSSGESMHSVAIASTPHLGAMSLQPGMAAVTVLPPHPLTLVTPAVYHSCGSSHTSWPVSSEPFTVPTTALPGLPALRSLWSLNQLHCGSGECLPAEQRCDLHPDCQDGSDEEGCGSSCIFPCLGAAAKWTSCAASPALCRPAQWLGHGQSGRRGAPAVSPVEMGTRVTQGAMWTPNPRIMVPPALGPPRRGSPVACSPVQVTQVRGCWAQVALWASLGSPHKVSISPQTVGRVHVNAELCREGLVPLCPPSCLDPKANRSCTGQCVEEALGWTPWTPWSPCSQSCLVPGGGPSWRRCFWLCPSPRDSCHGEANQEEPCSPPLCPAQCPGDMVFLSADQCHQEGSNSVCAPAQDCPCTHRGRLHPPGSAVLSLCENCSCVSGLITNCTARPCEEVQPVWSPWTPWSECSASCGPAHRHRHRFCPRPPSVAPSSQALLPPSAAPTPLCPGLEAEEEQRLLPACDRAGGWGPWGPRSSCSRSCGGGLRGRTRACDQPPPEGLRHFCEGPQAQGETCQAQQCPVTNCTTSKGPSTAPVALPVPDPVTTSCTCSEGRLNCTDLPCPGVPENHSRSVGSGLSSWESLEPGEVVTGLCDNCTCVAGILQCQEMPSCPGAGMWGSWGPREDCSVSCGGGEQLRSQLCPQPPCPGLAQQSHTCRTQVCREVGCPADRLYRECQPSEGCPFSCAHIMGQVACFSSGCEEGCHCPKGTFQHHSACVQECPCVRTAMLLQELGATSTEPGMSPTSLGEEGQHFGPGDELDPGQTFRTGCSNCRQCVRPTLAPGGQGCLGPQQDLEDCPSLDCPGAEGSKVEPVTALPGGANRCPRRCSDLQDGVVCEDHQACQQGCRCPEGSLEQDGRSSTSGWAPHCREEQSQSQPCPQPLCLQGAHPRPVGDSWLQGERQQCSCTPEGPCTRLDGHFRPCPIDPRQWSAWEPWSPCQVPCRGGFRLCWRKAGSPLSRACQGPWAQTESCKVESYPGESCEAQGTMLTLDCANQCPLLHNGICVPPAACPCTQLSLPWGLSLSPEELAQELPPGTVLTQNCTHCVCQGPGSEWQEGCDSCHCPRGTSICTQLRPRLTCTQGEVLVQEPESCCPTCRREILEEQPASCRHLTELCNLTKGPCHLDQVEVSYCSGHCPPSTNVMAEEPYLQSQCDYCSYRLDPDSPMRILHLRRPDGHAARPRCCR
ncbi:SCO-spondin [Heterocephalus glaber]|uniref:SCO-spondin n=1 Tax=Heterocephalus glaber TaxID=10181 RepID=G5AML5_HETGA|nr:SCO-spondin [Heterocephalus glaber]